MSQIKFNNKNFRELSELIGFIGLPGKLDEALQESMRQGKDTFSLEAFHEIEPDKLKMRFYFERPFDNTYNLTNYQVKLYDPVKLDHLTDFNPVIKDLAERMRKTDWFFDLAENMKEWTEGYKMVGKMEDELRLLSHFSDGDKIAAYLWNNIVPPISTDKPEFIRRIEDTLSLYPQKVFSSEIPLLEAYGHLKDYRKIEEYLSQFLIAEFSDNGKRSQIIDGLSSGEQEQITFIKSLVPLENIDKYVLIEHAYPKGMIYEEGHSYSVIGSFTTYHEAINSLKNKSSKGDSQERSSDRPELLVIGQYRDKEIEYNYECHPEVNTGLVIAKAFSSVSPQYEISFVRDLNHPVRVAELMNAEVNLLSGNLQFSDCLHNPKTLDEEFWITNRYQKAKLEISKEPIGVPETTKSFESKATSKEKGDCLLPKNRVSADRGKCIG